jgi:hypothetical protein
MAAVIATVTVSPAVITTVIAVPAPRRVPPPTGTICPIPIGTVPAIPSPAEVDVDRCSPIAEHGGDVTGFDPNLVAHHNDVVIGGVIHLCFEEAVPVPVVVITARHPVRERLEPPEPTGKRVFVGERKDVFGIGAVLSRLFDVIIGQFIPQFRFSRFSLGFCRREGFGIGALGLGNGFAVVRGV